MPPRGRPRAFDRDAALEAAMTLFWQRGFSATSMADLCAAMGISAPSLYAAFGSKEDLYEAALLHYTKTGSPLIWGRLEAIPSARAAIADMLMASARSLPGTDRPAGCMVTLSSVGQECESRLGPLVAAARAEGVQRIAARLERAVAEGELPDGVDISRLARFFVCVQQGMSLQARDGAGQAELSGIAEAAMAAWPG